MPIILVAEEDISARGKLPGAPAGPCAPETSSARGHVMVTEDDPHMRRVLVLLLVSLGYTVTEAGDGAAAIALARQKKPDIMLLDIFMPEKNGLEVLKELCGELPGTGFIMVTGNMDEETACSCLALGASDYVPKPVNLDELAHTIKARLLLQRPA